MAITKWQPPALRHSVAESGRVAWLELFFDLIYVAALIQLGDQLSDDVSWSGSARFVGMFVVLWWTWTGTTAFLNRFATDDVAQRGLVFVQMFAVGNLALVAVAPIENRWSWLVVVFVAARLPLLVMYARARHVDAASRRLSKLYIASFGTGIAIWVVSLLVPTPARFAVWAVALGIEFLAPVVGVRRADPPPTHVEHFAERYALFTIIVLGESFVKILSELADVGVSAESQVFGLFTFAVTVAIWWTYFDDIAGSALRNAVGRLRHSGSIRVIWVYAHLPLAAGLTAFGVASKKVVVVETFTEPLRDTYLWLTSLSIGVVMIATAAVDGVTTSSHFAVSGRQRIAARVLAAVGVVLVAVVAAIVEFSALLFISLVAAIVVVQIAAEVSIATRAERTVRRRVAGGLERGRGTCEHLGSTDPGSVDIEPGTEAVCGECVRLDTAWVQLRVCLECGEIGCCDESDGRHATAHHHATGHPAIASAEIGDVWAYCYVDDVSDPDWAQESR